jgi:hypothetical protein
MRQVTLAVLQASLALILLGACQLLMLAILTGLVQVLVWFGLDGSVLYLVFGIGLGASSILGFFLAVRLGRVLILPWSRIHPRQKRIG